MISFDMDYTINIIETCGKNVVSRDDGKRVRSLIENKWTAVDKIKINFGNVLIASVSFFDEIFGQLAFEYSRAELTDKIVVENIQEYDRALLNDILRSRFREKEVQAEAS